jgi:histidine decarboxylase
MMNLIASKEFLKPQSNCLASYVLEMLTAIHIDALKDSFANLPGDPYLEGNYRFRRLSHFQAMGDRLIKLPHRHLFQSKQYNPLMGDVVREYAELDDGLIQLESFQHLVWEFFEYCQICSRSNVIAVHQIRTTATSETFGNPAPEGIHRDGVDVVGIFSVDRHDIGGGETHLYTTRTGEQAIFSKVLNPGEFLVFKDDQYFHYTSPVKAIGSELGIRDVFVLTSPGLFPPDETV